MSANLALRIGVVLSGTVIAEHVLRDRRPFSVGQSTRTTVSVPLADLPRRWDLLTLVDGGIQLRLPSGAEARVSEGASVFTRADLDRRGAVAGGVTTVVLPTSARGRIELGELRILFQGVHVPVVAAPRLPRALQPTLGERIDRRLAAVVAGSLVVHLGLMVVARFNDPPGHASMAQRATEQYQDETLAVIDADDPLLDLGEPDEPAKPDEPTKPDPASGKPAAQVPNPSPRPDPGPRPGRPADPGALSDPIADSNRYADMLFGPGTDGLVATDLTARKPGTDLAQQLQEIKDGDQNAAIGDGTQTHTRDGDGPRRGTIDEQPIPGTPTPIVTPPKDGEKVPPGRIKPLPPSRPPGGPDVDSIIRKIATTYMGGLQRCYKDDLRGDARTAGKIVLTFTVTDRGQLTDGAAAGVSDTLERCIETAMKRWSFTPVVDDDGDATDVDVRLPLQLTPI